MESTAGHKRLREEVPQVFGFRPPVEPHGLPTAKKRRPDNEDRPGMDTTAAADAAGAGRGLELHSGYVTDECPGPTPMDTSEDYPGPPLSSQSLSNVNKELSGSVRFRWRAHSV
mmetsp:Transcript_4031/g.14249  ORF Transcript_4031/g.14249 Transcript_4031/m.14249 type:complete len:114 (+) Transcript_4031:65-406(+)